MLRNTVLAFASLVSVSAFAQGVDFDSSKSSVGFVNKAEVLFIESGDCGTNPACDAMTKVTVKLGLGACLANLGPVSYQLSTNDDGSIKITIAAISIIHNNSMLVRCKKLAEENVEIFIRGSHDQFTLNLLNNL